MKPSLIPTDTTLRDGPVTILMDHFTACIWDGIVGFMESSISPFLILIPDSLIDMLLMRGRIWILLLYQFIIPQYSVASKFKFGSMNFWAVVANTFLILRNLGFLTKSLVSCQKYLKKNHECEK